MFDRCIRIQARERPNAPAVITPQGKWSFQWLDAAVDRAAFELKDVVPSGQEPVRVDITNEPLHWLISLALARRGIASSPASDKGCSVEVSDTGERGASHVIEASALERILNGGGLAEMPDVDPPRHALGRVIRSSGTMGEAKRIGLSWQVIEARIRNAILNYGPFDGPFLIDPDINTALGFTVTLTAWTSGNAVIWNCPLGNAPELERLRPSIICAVPFRLQLLIDAFPPDYQMWPLRIISGGGPIPKALATQLGARITSEIANVYGSSEAGAVTLADLPTMTAAERAAGYVLPSVELEVVAPDGTPVPPGEMGEIRVRGENLSDGYLPPADTDAAFRDGWYYTSDLGRLDADGLLHVEGRVDDVMNLGGVKILPAWIEEAALRCPGVEDAAAFALSDTSSTVSCCLALVRNADYEQSRLVQSLSEQLRHVYQMNLFIVSSIPRNAMGKVDRNQLRALYRAQTGGGNESIRVETTPPVRAGP